MAEDYAYALIALRAQAKEGKEGEWRDTRYMTFTAME
jgi:hypothetical protein